MDQSHQNIRVKRLAKLGNLAWPRLIVTLLGCVLINLIFIAPARADLTSLRQTLSHLSPLSIHDGVNVFTLHDNRLMLVQGSYLTEDASGGHAVELLVKDSAGQWQIVARDDKGWDGLLAFDQPHTGDDKISENRYFISKNRLNPAFYWLHAERHLGEQLDGSLPVECVLRVMRYDDAFGLYRFHVEDDVTIDDQNYRSVDAALQGQLGLP